MEEVMLRNIIENIAKYTPSFIVGDTMDRINFEISLYIFLARFLNKRELEECIKNYIWVKNEFDSIFADKMNDTNRAGQTYKFVNEQIERFNVLLSKK